MSTLPVAGDRDPFKLGQTPLEPGTTLIEASAGTGKTYTIAGLVLLLILERKFSIGDILVVTYTEAATEELRDRIRRTLSHAAVELRREGPGTGDLAELLNRFRGERAGLIPLLQRAITNFDEAPIFTIHGFCQRTLKDRAFESGSLFDLELLADESDLVQAVADDYWRSRFYFADPVVVACALAGKLTPERLFEWLKQRQRRHGVRILSGLDAQTVEERTARLPGLFATVRATWQKEEEAISRLLAGSVTAGSVTAGERKWAKGDHAKPDLLGGWLEDVRAGCAGATPTPESLQALEKLTCEALKANTRADSATPDHPVFEQCTKLAKACGDWRTALQLDFLRRAGGDLARRKLERKQQAFDDLLLRLQEALHGPAGPALATEVRRRYRAALIDEFQDTDPVQCDIFQRLFAAPAPPAPPAASAGSVVPGTALPEVVLPGAQGEPGETAPGPSFLFLIGDPKQAIYAFRGADIFTYLGAAAGADHRYTLHKNYRSETPLVRAVNSVFDLRNAPFLFDRILFKGVEPAGKADATPLQEGGCLLPPLHLWFMPRPDGDKPIPRPTAEKALSRSVAGEIVRLLNGGAQLGGRSLAPEDVAILVRTHQQARLMQEGLSAVNVPSVLRVEESVFSSPEAVELARVLAAISQPGQERLLRGALATELMGLTAEQLENLAGQQELWQQRAEGFHSFRTLWLKSGFTVLFRKWLREEKVRARLLGFSDGERRLTNLLHLAELLHQAEHSRQLGPLALVRWFNDQIAAPDHAGEENQLRLERDDQAVRIVTIHKSKGLEYPVVFCPFSWQSMERRNQGDEEIFCHREETTPSGPRTELVWDLGSEDLAEHKERAMRERLAEGLRLLYVALTRARHRCYLVWGAFTGAGSSAAAWLFHGAALPASATASLKDLMEERFKSLEDSGIRADLQTLIARSSHGSSHPTIQLQDLPTPDGTVYQPAGVAEGTLRPREFRRTLARDWRITSFSNLTAQAADERPDHDPLGAPETPVAEGAGAALVEAPPAGFFAFPRGTGPGTCLHKIFEEIDFLGGNPAGLEQLVHTELHHHGLPADEWTATVSTAVRRTLITPLDPAAPGLMLSAVPTSARLNELEFQFPVGRLSPALLQEGMGTIPEMPDLPRRLARLGFKPVRGFVKGFIDLVFLFNGRYYLLDWKSNWLGNRAEDYHPERLRREMGEKLYVLQYHLYTVALHQYLQLRLPGYAYDQHFGGALYVFLRGLDPAHPECGLFRDRPPLARIEQLSRQLMGSVARGGIRSSEDVTP